MEKAYDSLSENQIPNDYSKGRKRIKLLNDGDKCSTTVSPTDTSNSNSDAVANAVDQLGRGKYGSVTKVIEKLLMRRNQVLGAYRKRKASDLDVLCSRESSSRKDVPRIQVPVIDLEDDSAPKKAPAAITPIVILDSDEEDNDDIKLTVASEGDNSSDKPTSSFQGIVLEKSVGKPIIEIVDHWEGESQGATTPLLQNDTDRDNGFHDCAKEEENIEIKALEDGRESRSQGATTPLLESDTDRDNGFHDCAKEEENIEIKALEDGQESRSQGAATPLLESDTDRDNGFHDCAKDEENIEIKALEDGQESRSQGATTPLLESDTDRDNGFHDCAKEEEENIEIEALNDGQESRSQGATTRLLESDTDRDHGFHDCVKEEKNAEIEALEEGQDDGQESRSQGVTTLLLESDTSRDKGKGVCVDVKEDEENVESEAEDNDQESESQGSDMDRDKGVYLGVNEEENTGSEAEDDALGELWNQMSFAMEVSKDDFEYPSADEHIPENEEFCDHSFVLKDDLGYVCRVCGVIQRAIETIIDIQFNKVKSLRTYMPNSRNAKDRDLSNSVGLELLKDDLMVTGISAHPRHLKHMKPHQVEGFKFLCDNLVAENPGGCILAHAPGSGKTFMIISFLQSFLAKYPHGRPLVVLPKGILQTWKKEFLTWQIEDIPLLDLYSGKVESRAQQLEVLKQWVDQKSILFLGYKQFSTIVCDDGKSNAAINCQNILLSRPSILILDEGHTPRNEDTEVLQSLAKVHTPRKVVLSGTLFQNHVKEVFNILNLVRPKFLKSDTSRSIMKRIMSKVHIPSGKKQFRVDVEAAFFELVEHTIQRDDDFRRKVAVIQDLREMTSTVLHYYKGDFLDDLPGLVDFTVVLSLTAKQKDEVSKLKQFMWKFKRISVGSAIYLHPKLNALSENSSLTDNKMDELLQNIDCKDGVKANFFLNILNLCESAGERLLVFSQYLPPLKFLERLVMKAKGWSLGREVFVISGESSTEQREYAMERFNNSSDAKVFFGSIKACGEGISLVGASRVIILDVHLNPSVTRQAIGRAFRPGQKKVVYVYRLVAADSPEEEDHSTCFKKETIAKMWFEWNEYCGYRNFEMENVQLSECGDLFLESSLVRRDIQALYKR